MKKIVAIVLAMVMVLGLATVAMADTTTTVLKAAEGYEIYAMDGTAATVTGTDITKIVTGNVTTTAGDKTTVTYTAVAYEVSGIGTYIEVDPSVATGKLVNKAGAIVAFVQYVASVPSTTKVATATVEAKLPALRECGDITADGVVVDGKTYVAGGDKWAVYNGKFISYTETLVGKVPHVYEDAAFSAKDASVVTIGCDECDATWTVLTAKQVAAMAPSAFTTVTTASGTYYVAVAADAPAADATDKVESAQTFDAGIAMYVGMSVMAAAGSAVVLKKKD